MPRKIASSETVANFVSEYGYKLSGEFVHSLVNIILICPNGHNYQCRFSDFKSGRRCSVCNKENRIKKTIVYYKDYVGSNSDYIFLGLNNKQIEIICPNGHLHSTFFHSFKNGFGCSQCSGNKKYTYEEIKRVIESNGYSLLSNTYKNANTKLHLKCPEGHDYFTVYNSFRQGYRCQKCYLSSNIGESSPNWKGGITPIANHLRGKINDWKIDSLKAYSFRCAISNEYSRELEIHHTYGFSSIVRELFEELGLQKHQKLKDYSDQDIKNVEALCLKKHYEYGLGIPLLPHIHKEFHDIYGKGNNTIEQFEEFKSLYGR